MDIVKTEVSAACEFAEVFQSLPLQGIKDDDNDGKYGKRHQVSRDSGNTEKSSEAYRQHSAS